MKFLQGDFTNKNIMPLNIYYSEGSRTQWHDDFIDIVFKDMDTGKKYVETILNPEMEVWIVKPEFRTFNYIANLIEKPKCYPIRVHYKTRYSEVGKHLKCSSDQAKYSPYVCGLDVKIDHFYLMEFIKEYHNEKRKVLSMGFLDIENDILQCDGFPTPGEAPISAVTYIDVSQKQVYTICLRTCNVPHVPESHKNYEKYKSLRAKFESMFEHFETHIPEFIEEMHQSFDEDFGELGYNILIAPDERELLKMLSEIIRLCQNDYVFIWNAPYDVQNIFSRPANIGIDANDLIIDPAFYGEYDADDEPEAPFVKNTKGANLVRRIQFVEDNNPVVFKRKHLCRSFTFPSFECQMRVYTGIRSGMGKLPSSKLNFVARRELKNEKLDFAEEGNMKYFLYTNLWKYFKYNIKDVLLQYGIDKKTNDSATFYSMIYDNAVFPSEIFTSTQVLLNSIRMFVFDYKKGYVLGSNRHKLYPNQITNYEAMIADFFAVGDTSVGDSDDPDDDDYDDDDGEFSDYDTSEFEEDDSNSTDPKKRKKFKGAYVMTPEHMSPSGFTLLGKLRQYIHNFCIDMDIGAEYPSAIIITNCSNDTLVAKVFFENPADITIPIYKEFRMTPEEKKEYTVDKDKGAYLTEVYSEGDMLNFGRIFLNLPSTTSILTDVGMNIKDLIK